MTRNFVAALALLLAGAAQAQTTTYTWTDPTDGTQTRLTFPSNYTLSPSGASQPPAIAETPASPAAGSALSVKVTLAPGYFMTGRDWVSISTAGSADGAFVSWLYVNGTQTPDNTLRAGPVTLTMTAPAAGNYEVRYLPGDGNQVVARQGFTTH